MSRKLKFLLLALLVSVCWSTDTQAQTINAASCSSSAVQAALNSVAADGTVVNIPAGTCTWTTSISYHQVYSTTIQGQTVINGDHTVGATAWTATDNTTITTNTGGPAINFATAAGKSFRLTGLTIINASTNTPAYGLVNVTGASTSTRVDHNHFFDNVGGGHTLQHADVTGVVDHNLFDAPFGANLIFTQYTIGYSGSSHASWAKPDNFGGSNWVFYEDNLFQHGNFTYDCNYGGRMVFRYDIFGANTRGQTHGTGSGQTQRGCRAKEIYYSSFKFSANGNQSSPAGTFPFVDDQEAGTYLFWGNSVYGFSQIIREDNVRTNTVTYGQLPQPPSGFGMCGTIYGPTNWDQNTDSSGYPCLDATGRGQGDLLTGNTFATMVNSTTGTVSWPHQALSPVYMWGNSFDTCCASTWGQYNYWSSMGGVLHDNRDIYTEVPNYNRPGTFNGTIGVGCGPGSGISVGCNNPVAQPSTCTTGVTYWNTTSQTLYQCTATNTWTAYYKPYTYPHPLVTGGSAGIITPPTNLNAIVN